MKKSLLVDDYMLDKVLDKIREIIGIEKFDNKILIDTVYTLKNDINNNNVRKGDGWFYPQIFLEA